MASAELSYYAKCDLVESNDYINHLLNCARAWPLSTEDEAVLNEINRVFIEVQKPTHFTDYLHCDECEMYDNRLTGNTRERISRYELSNLGGDPLTMSSAEGFAYYFPALARYALLPDIWHGYDWYAEQLIHHLSSSGVGNDFLAWCSTQQQMAVYQLLLLLSNSRFATYKARELVDALNAWEAE